MVIRRPRGQRTRLRQRLDLHKTLFVLPNLITLGSVFCGFNAIQLLSKDATEPDFYKAAFLLMYAMFFDLMDGRVARMTRTQSAFGLQLDSLADVISFGVAPALLVYRWVLHRHPFAGSITAFMFVACAAVRLARFNVLSSSTSGAPVKPGKYIIGLPTPPASACVISLVLANHAIGGNVLNGEPYTLTMFVVTILLSLLMVSNVRFRSFKNLRRSTGTAFFFLFTIGSSAFVWLQFKPQFVLVWLLGFYILIGIVEWMWSLAARITGRPEERDSIPSPPR